MNVEQSGSRGDEDRKDGDNSPWERYARQILIPEWNEAVQKKLDCTHVTVVGAGGLGSPVLLYLAAAGIGELYFIDHDTVSLTNLNRQILYNESDIGASKAKAAAGHLTVLFEGVPRHWGRLVLRAGRQLLFLTHFHALHSSTRFRRLVSAECAFAVPLYQRGTYPFRR